MNSEGFRFGLDNGAWSAFQQGREIDLFAFESAVETHGAAADWVVAPDIVAGGLRSLDLTASWLYRLRHLQLTLIAVQDGMLPHDVAPLMGPRIGIFLGGSTDWKLSTMQRWGDWCMSIGAYYHVARVNTARRIRMAHRGWADSFDGSSASRYAVTLPLLEGARRQPNLLSIKPCRLRPL